MRGLWSLGSVFSRYKTRSVTTDLWVSTVTERDQKQSVTHKVTRLLRGGCPVDAGKVSRKQKGKQQDDGHLG